MKRLAALVGIGAGLTAVAGAIGGRGAVAGGALAVLVQAAAVLVLRPAMRGPQPAFLARWFAGMGLRALGAGLVLFVGATHRDTVPLLPAALGYLGVLVPLLVTETRFLG